MTPDPTAALSAAGVPALTAEVERLRVELEAARGRVEASDEGFAAVQTEWHAALARATSAEQERDRLRAKIEAALAECDRADEALSRQSRTGATFVHERVRALLAGSGEQPAPMALVRVEWGVVLDDLGSTDVYDTREEAEARAGRDSTVVRIETWRVGSGEQPPCICRPEHRDDDPICQYRPAPVVPDSGHVLTEYGTTSCPVEAVRAEVADGACSACGAAVPDSPDVYETIRAFIEEEVGFDGGPAMDHQARRLTDRVLAVVRQGVTAEEGGWEVSALLSDDRYRVKRTAGGWLVLTRSDRAVVRSGEQGGEA